MVNKTTYIILFILGSIVALPFALVRGTVLGVIVPIVKDFCNILDIAKDSYKVKKHNMKGSKQ